MKWSVEDYDELTIKITMGDTIFLPKKDDVSFKAADTQMVIVSFNIPVNLKFDTQPLGLSTKSFIVNYKECTSPINTSRDGLVSSLNLLLSIFESSKDFIYLGDNLVQIIEYTDNTKTTVELTKDFSYDMSGNLVTKVETARSSVTTYTYIYDINGNITNINQT